MAQFVRSVVPSRLHTWSRERSWSSGLSSYVYAPWHSQHITKGTCVFMYSCYYLSTAKRRWHTGSRQIAEVKHRRAWLVPGWVITREHPMLQATLGALDTWRSRDLSSAECASPTTRILHNSPLKGVTGAWTWLKKKTKKKLPVDFFPRCCTVRLSSNRPFTRRADFRRPRARPR